VLLLHCSRLRQRPLAYVDVFVDDFCGFGQDHPQMPLQLQGRAVLHSIDKVFRPSDSLDGLHHNEHVSVKKLDQQDAAFQDVKRCLGWDHGTASKTLSRAPHQEQKALAALRDARSRTRIGQRPWQSLVGQLRSLVDGITSSLGQFSLLQAALQEGHKGRV
jgi:hypothetical protein